MMDLKEGAVGKPRGRKARLVTDITSTALGKEEIAGRL
jgi:hypothetical protein